MTNEVLTAGEIAAVLGGQLTWGDPGARVDGFSIDSRTIGRGDLFLAIRGTRFDGHTFVPAALRAGACGAVVSELAGEPVFAAARSQFLIIVTDTTRALQALAKHIRRASGARVVAITGSAGKTTTKEVAADLLSARYDVFRSHGNLNNHIGLPLSLLELRRRPEVAVVELGMSHPGEIRTLVSIAEPDVRVWTNVAEVHSEFFPSLEAIADAKAEILEEAGPDARLVANANDDLVMSRVATFPGKVTTFGADVAADVSASHVRDLGLGGMLANVRAPVGGAALFVPLLGRGNLANILAAMAVAMTFEVPLRETVGRVSRLRPAPHRGEIIRLRDDITVVDDSYNSNPCALERMLEVVAHEGRAARRVAVLGEMLELGARSAELHAACGLAAAAAGVQRLVTVGGEPARIMGDAAVSAGMPPSAVSHLETSDAAVAAVSALVRAGDLVLIKGSRGVELGRVVTGLTAEFA